MVSLNCCFKHDLEGIIPTMPKRSLIRSHSEISVLCKLKFNVIYVTGLVCLTTFPPLSWLWGWGDCCRAKQNKIHSKNLAYSFVDCRPHRHLNPLVDEIHFMKYIKSRLFYLIRAILSSLISRFFILAEIKRAQCLDLVRIF